MVLNTFLYSVTGDHGETAIIIDSHTYNGITINHVRCNDGCLFFLTDEEVKLLFVEGRQ